MSKRIAKKVLLIGWDAADWKVISPLLDAGKMPTLQKLVDNGVMGNLATLDPPLSPMLWTSIATGKRPYKHGIHGFTEPDPSGKGIRPIFNSARKVKAIWNILNQHDLKSHVVGWWPSHPAEPINGTMVSNFFQKATAPVHKDWTMMDGTVHPPGKAELFAQFRVHPHELTEEHILPFIPNAHQINQTKTNALKGLTKTIADAASIQAVSTYILEHEEWDFCAFYFDAIDHFCHGFMRFHPPQQDFISDEDFELYKGVIEGAYIYHDMMLERLLKLAGDDAHVMLISDHGFHPDHLRPKSIPLEPAGPATEHSPYGVFLLSGNGIKKDERIYGANLLDITPTILSLFGLPTAADMDGKVLSNVFEQPQETEIIESWELVLGNDGQHEKSATPDYEVAEEVLQQLIDLGYVEAPDNDVDVTVQKNVDENNFYLARAYLDGNQYEQAIELLEKLYKNNPTTTRYAFRLAAAYQATGQYQLCRDVLSGLNELEGKQKIPKLKMLLLEGVLNLNERKPKAALKCFLQLEKEGQPDLLRLQLHIGRGYLMLNQPDKAKTAFEKELQLDPDLAAGWHGLGLALLRLKRFEAAYEALLNAVGLQYNSPVMHFHLAQALEGAGLTENAIEAYQVCLKLLPTMNKARQALIRLGGDFPASSIQMTSTSSDPQTKGTVYVVSGLPRSGTSMMMQMLDKGGMDCFIDGIRGADENNPKGYYEHEAVKSIKTSNHFINGSVSKAVKVIAPLLPQLPGSYHYKVIFMERDVSEVIQSQQKMLVREGKLKSDQIPVQLVTSFEQTLQRIKKWLLDQIYMDVLFVSHQAAIQNPLETAKKVAQFVNQPLDIEEMASVVDPTLHRERIQ